MVNSKSSLAIALSKLEVFSSPKPKLEQYPTDSEIAADVLWQAYMNHDIEDRTIADLGCGTGILGIGTLLLGAKKVFFVDTDSTALELLKKNLESLSISKGFSIIHSDIAGFDKNVDLVVQNPPFGTRETHADRAFLEKATAIADVIYSFHKTTTRKFVESFAADNGFVVEHSRDFAFPLKQTLKQHKKKIQRIEVTCFRLEKG